MLFKVSEKTLLLRRLILVFLVLRNVMDSYASAASFGMQMVKSPESSVAPEGDEVIFECEFNLAPDKFIWRFQSEQNKDNEFKYLQKNGDGYSISNHEASSKLRIYVRPSNIGKYQCVAWYGDSAIVSLPANLTLASIQEDKSYANHKSVWKISPGNTVVIRCGSVTSNPSAVWSFYKNGEKLKNTDNLFRADSLVLNSVSHLDSGSYSCEAINSITRQQLRISHTIDLRIDSSNSSTFFPLTPSSIVKAIEGQSAILDCAGVGTPPPETIWVNQNKPNFLNKDVKILPIGLYFSNVTKTNAGIYECILNNGRVPTIKKTITLEVLTKPEIIKGISENEISAKEEQPETLECKAIGFPEPRIRWLINGESIEHDPNIRIHENQIIFKSVKKQYAGIIQCFAENEVGQVFQANFFKVIPIVRNNGPITSSHRPTPGSKYTPPTTPIVTKLSDTSVMLQWMVPPNNGLAIEFFKIQYRLFGNKTKQNWETYSDQIDTHPSRKYTQEVTDLKTDFSYKFRILAVYSNHDNKEGPTSQKFHLHSCTKKNCALPQPNIKSVEGISEKEIQVEWEFPHHSKSIDGFYLYYRPVESAGKYLIHTVHNNNTRKTVISGLEANTAYEFKIRSYSTTLASEFSEILNGKTNKNITIAPSTTTTTLPPKEETFKTTIYSIVGPVIGGCVVLLVIITIFFFKFQKRNGNFFKTPADDGAMKPNVNLSNLHHHTHLNLNNKNGATKDQNLRINITSNPLDQQIEV